MTRTSKSKVPIWLIKLLITISIFSIIGIILMNSKQNEVSWDSLWISLKSISPLILILIMLMAVLNWLLESVKWQLLIRRIEYVTLFRAFISVLTGLSFGFVTPRSVGDYFGRMLHLESKNRTRVVGALLISRLSQLFITLLFGGFGLLYFLYNDLLVNSSELRLNLTLALVLFVIVIVIILLRKMIIRKLFRSKIGDRIIRLISVIREYNNVEIMASLGLSMLRYMVFATQFVLMLYTLGFTSSLISIYSAIGLVYLAKSIFVSFNFLSDLGVRELAALGFLGCLSSQTQVIITASLLIWLINILLPTVVGALFTNSIKLKIS